MCATRTRRLPRPAPLACAAALGGVLVLACVIVTPAAQRSGDNPREVLDRAVEDFLAGRLSASVAGFDRVAALAPQAAPQLWQRGIALYYAGRYQDCRAQFESHRTVNPDDVENPAWHFMCVAKAESPAKARAALLPVGPDQRSPMREIYEMFRGTMTPEAILAAGGAGRRRASSPSSTSASTTTRSAIGRGPHNTCATPPPRTRAAGGYMHRVAELHPLLRTP